LGSIGVEGASFPFWDFSVLILAVAADCEQNGSREERIEEEEEEEERR
jgi:hypothetical protein